MKTARVIRRAACVLSVLAFSAILPAQSLLDIDFGSGAVSPKGGMAATGIGTNDFWNLYRHYDPKFTPGTALVANGKMDKLKYADRSDSPVSITVSNAPGLWGNATGDPMYDSYVYSQNGSNILVAIHDLPPGRYHIYLYGHADPDVTGEQNSVFTLRAGTNRFGPTTQTGGTGWKANQPWQEGAQYVVFRDVPIDGGAVRIEVAPGPNGVAVLNGLQIISRGTSPPRPLVNVAPAGGPIRTNLLFHEIHYEGQVSDSEAKFAVNLSVESMTTNEISAPLFEGDVALLDPVLPEGVRIVAEGQRSRLFCAKPGTHTLKFTLQAKISRAEPWNQVSFTGPPAAIASVTARASADGVQMELLSGTQLGSEKREASRLTGFLGADRVLSLRWQGKTAEVSRKSLVTVDTACNVQMTPAVLKFTTTLRYNILQAAVPELKISLPAEQALTRLQGDQIRDWQVQPDGGRQVLTVQFIKPVQGDATLTLFSEQTMDTTPFPASLAPPEPIGVEREAGEITLTVEDTTVEPGKVTGLRQVNAAAGAVAAWRFNNRPALVQAVIKRIEPVITVTDRAAVKVEDTRLLVNHGLDLRVEKAGVYNLDLVPETGITISEVTGDGIDDWKSIEGRLRISFTNRVLGTKKINVQLTRPYKEVPGELTVAALGIPAATNVMVQLGVASAAGIRVKSSGADGLREVPVTSLPQRSDELLAFAGEQTKWQLRLEAEKLPPRVLAEVFNLVTIGDGLVGGSATVRFGILNQGVQQFRIAVPPHWKNLEFTGANIRRKEQQQTNIWTISLQDKAWGGYTLVLTYDYQFDPKGGQLNLAGAHPLDVERETGSLGVMTAASLKLTPAAATEPMRRVDEAELPESDRSLCTRPLLLAWKYAGTNYQQTVEVSRYEELSTLAAVADRIELTTVITEQGQLLTQSSFMVKNNEKQFQRFQLPANAQLWSSFVNGLPAKPERDGDWYLVPLPRDANRDQAFAVDIVYAETNDLKRALFPKRLELKAPVTDIPNTYAEWQLFMPVSQRLSSFEGNMTVARGTTYDLRDAWRGFVEFYGDLIEHHLGTIIFCFCAALILILLASMARRGMKGVVEVIVVFAIIAILGAMLLPALSKAKSRAQRINAVNNLKQIGLAARLWCQDNGSTLPPNFDAMKNELGTDKILTDPNTGQPFVYVGAGKDSSYPNAIIAYSPSDVHGRAVLMADGSVQVMNSEKFQEALQQDATVPRAVVSANQPGAPSFGTYALQDAPRSSGEVLSRSAEVAAVEAPPPAPMASPAPALRGTPRGTSTPVTNSTSISGGFGGGVSATPLPAETAATKATATGIRPIRIDVPRTGQAFSFTKVLNAGDEPLKIKVSVMRLAVYRAIQMILQVSAFVIGLLMFWVLLMRAERSSFWMTVAIALILWGVARLLFMWRVLHIGLIAAIPLAVFSLAAWGAYRWWLRHKARRAIGTEEPPAISPGNVGPAPALVVAFLLSLAFAIETAGAKEKAAPAVANSVSLVSATYEGQVHEKVAQFELALRVVSNTTNQVVPLFGDEVAVESFAAEGGAHLVREEGRIAAVLPNPGAANLQIKLAVRVGGDVGRRQLAFSIPSALASQVNLVIDEPDADVEFPGAVTFTQNGSEQQTRVSGVIGSGGRFELNWTPRVKRAAEIAATVFAQNFALITFGGGVAGTRAVLDYQVSQGELRELRIQLPEGNRLLRVEGQFIRTWTVKDDVLTVELVKPIAPAYTLTLETEKVLDKLPTGLTVQVPHPLGVKRETGMLGLRGSEELSVAVAESSGLQRVDADEFHRAAPSLKDGLLSAFRFLRPDFTLRTQIEQVQPQIEAVVRNQITISAEAVRLDAFVDYTIKRAGVFSLQLAVPSEYRIDSVKGANIVQWVEHAGNERTVEVTLKERTVGSYALSLHLTRLVNEPPKSLRIAAVRPEEIARLNGYLTVSAEPGISVKTDSLEGLVEIPIASVPGDPGSKSASGLAYKLVSSDVNGKAWQLSVSTEAVEPWVRAEIANTFTVNETLVNGKALLRYDIANAPVKDFRIKVPATFKNVEISGNQIRRRDETNGEWRIELQSKVRGEYFLTVTWEQPRTNATEILNLHGVQALSVERESGFLTVVAHPPLQVSPQGGAELLSAIDARELPAWFGRADAETVLSYRYVRPGYALRVEARRYNDAEVLQALIENARLTTVVADDGQMITELALSVRNNGRQHLELAIPAGANVWSAFISGEPVRPGIREGELLLPLTRDVASDTAIPVELTFVSTNTFPRRSGKVALASPTFDVPLKNAKWDLFLPPEYEYSHFEGTMTRTSDTTLPTVQVYSLSEYNLQQRQNEEQQDSEVKRELGEVTKNLKGSNLREAVSSYGRAKFKGQSQGGNGNRDGNWDFKQVEQELRRAQSSNLLGAQNGFYLGNAAKFGDGLHQQQLAAPVDPATGLPTGANFSANLYNDADVAGLQWEKLERAQQVAVAKVAPLRVNLPTHGVHISFAQVLQTERGKPMTIKLEAENTRTASWFSRGMLTAIGFSALWGLVGLFNNRAGTKA